MKSLFKFIFFLILVFGLVCCQKNSAEQPNIVVIIADDMNWDDCGAYGHKSIRTPNIDQLAKDGMRFDHAYIVASSCSPSRASIMMGRYPHNTGAEQLHWDMPKGTKTFVEALKKKGYYTASAGKWHMGDNIRSHFDVIHEASVSGFQLPVGETKAPARVIAKKPSGCEAWVSTLKARPKDKPFFMWFAALDPHRDYEEGSLDPPHKTRDVVVPAHLADTPGTREDLRLYYDEIGRLDVYVGEVIDELERQGVTEETLILFMSDNGRPFPRDKTTLYEGGIKTPWIVKWPGKVEAGSVQKALVSSIDLAPTFSQIAGAETLKEYEGENLLPIFNQKKDKVRDYIFAEDHWHDYEDHGRAVVTHRYKLIRNTYNDLPATPSADAFRSPTWQSMLELHKKGKLTEAQKACLIAPRPKLELYDLEKDPQEFKNLIDDASYTEVKEELLKALDQWSQDTDDFVPSLRTQDEFDRLTGKPDHSVRKRPRDDKKTMFGAYGKY